MNFGPALALMVLMVPTAIAAAFVGWRALRVTPPNWTAFTWAYVILLSPFVLSTLRDRDRSEGFMLAVEVAGFTVMTPLVGLALAAGALHKHGRAKYVLDRYSPVVTMHRLADGATFADIRERLTKANAETHHSSTVRAFYDHVAIAEATLAAGERNASMPAEAARIAVAASADADRDQFLGMLFWLAAFGGESARRVLAASWVSRRFEVAESPSRTALGNGVAALLLDDYDSARVQLSLAAAKEKRLVLTAVAHAGLALADRDWDRFERHIMASLHEYHDEYKRLPADPAGAMNVFALAMVRLAAEAGFAMTERPYLPVSLLTAHK